MRASVYHGPRDIRVEEVPDATIREPTDALVRVTHACICGSDLWPYRGELEIYGRPGPRSGTSSWAWSRRSGAEVRTLAPGQRVIAPFAFSDGTCEYCRGGPPHLLPTGGLLGRPQRRRPGRGGARAARRRHAGRAARRRRPLRRPPRGGARDADRRDGHRPPRRAVGAGSAPGATAVVVGDGAVGLCAVLAARRLGRRAGHRRSATTPARLDDRPPLRRHRRGRRARRRGRRAGARAHRRRRARTCSSASARRVLRDRDRPRPPGRRRGPRRACRPSRSTCCDVHIRNIRLIGGVAPVRGYIPELLDDVLAGRLDPSPVLDLVVPLEEVPEGYAAMDERRAIKVLVRTGSAWPGVLVETPPRARSAAPAALVGGPSLRTTTSSSPRPLSGTARTARPRSARRSAARRRRHVVLRPLQPRVGRGGLGAVARLPEVQHQQAVVGAGAEVEDHPVLGADRGRHGVEALALDRQQGVRVAGHSGQGQVGHAASSARSGRAYEGGAAMCQLAERASANWHSDPACEPRRPPAATGPSAPAN